jgi:hypothetical protein
VIAWYWAAIGGLYAAGVAVMFVIHSMFDGGLIYPTKKDGPVYGLLFASTWPLWAVVLIVGDPHRGDPREVAQEAVSAPIRFWRDEDASRTESS